ncbi:MAG: hypothetical protein V1797_18260 [Pseudomonadota bacterium]
MDFNQSGPPGRAKWDELYPELSALNGGRLTMAIAVAEAPAQVRELVTLVEAHPLALTWDGRKVGLREIDKAKLAESMDVVVRCVEIVDGEQELVCRWLASLLR